MGTTCVNHSSLISVDVTKICGSLIMRCLWLCLVAAAAAHRLPRTKDLISTTDEWLACTEPDAWARVERADGSAFFEYRGAGARGGDAASGVAPAAAARTKCCEQDAISARKRLAPILGTLATRDPTEWLVVTVASFDMLGLLLNFGAHLAAAGAAARLQVGVLVGFSFLSFVRFYPRRRGA